MDAKYQPLGYVSGNQRRIAGALILQYSVSSGIVPNVLLYPPPVLTVDHSLKYSVVLSSAMIVSLSGYCNILLPRTLGWIRGCLPHEEGSSYLYILYGEA